MTPTQLPQAVFQASSRAIVHQQGGASTRAGAGHYEKLQYEDAAEDRSQREARFLCSSSHDAPDFHF